MKKKLKKIVLFILVGILISTLFIPTAFATWGNNKRTVTFHPENGSNTFSVEVDRGTVVARPADPDYPGHTLVNWHDWWGNVWDFSSSQVWNDTHLFAGWDWIDYSVTYDGNGATSGSAPSGGTGYHIDDDVSVQGVGNLEKTGHTFGGWSWNGATYQAGNKVTIGTENVVLKAIWEPINYSVKYYANGATSGDVPADATYHIDNEVTVAGHGNLAKDGYEFDGWNTEAGGGGESRSEGSSFPMGDSNVDLYAQWIPNYYVEYYANGASGTVPTDSTIYHTGNTVTVAGEGGLVFDGHDFIGWDTKEDGSGDRYYEDGSFDMGSSNVKLYAQWKLKEFEVKFYKEDGATLIETKTVPWNTDAGAPSAPDITGYSFDEWVLTGTNADEEDSLTNVKEDIKAVASYEPISYTVTYDKNGGDGGAMDGSTHIYDVAKNLTANGYNKDGHTFAGWATSAESSSAKYGDGESVTNLADADKAIVPLYAVWNINQFDVTFYKQDGTTVIEQQKVNWDDAAQSVEAPSIPGYAFDKWVLEGDDDAESNSLTHVKENIKAVASYIKNGYTVTFLDYDGTVLGTDGVLYGEAATAPEETPARVGYTFTSWDKAFDNVTSNMTVTAQYAINTYTVKFVDFNGRELKTQTVNWNTAATAPANPTFTGYTFTGWDKAFDKVTSDLTVTAQYAINKYTVKFVDFDGKELSVQTVNWNTAATAPANPTYTGYTFTSWDKAFDKVTSDLTVTAQYAINKYTVKFVDYDGKELSVQTVNWGTAAIKPSDPIRWKYTFTGWDKAFNYVTSDLTVTAQYKSASLSDEDVPKTYDDSQSFPWGWIVAAAGLIGAIVWIVLSQMKKHKHTGDAI